MKNKRSLFLGMAIIIAFAAAIGVFLVVSQIQKQESYWVVATEIPARTRITAAMLEEETVRGEAPEAAISAAEVESGEYYARIALAPGDILTNSNAGLLDSLTVGIPEDFSVSSFTVAATNAAVGMAKRGDYIDIYKVDDSSGTSSLVLQHVLVLDAVASLDEVSQRSATSEEAQEGQEEGSTNSTVSKVSTIYQVGLSREDTAKLALLSTKNLFVALSPAAGPNAPIPPVISNQELESMIVQDSGKGTDPTFTPKGQPANGQAPAATEQQLGTEQQQSEITPEG